MGTTTGTIDLLELLAGVVGNRKCLARERRGQGRDNEHVLSMESFADDRRTRVDALASVDAKPVGVHAGCQRAFHLAELGPIIVRLCECSGSSGTRHTVGI
jgi:hypothetical protein